MSHVSGEQIWIRDGESVIESAPESYMKVVKMTTMMIIIIMINKMMVMMIQTQFLIKHMILIYQIGLINLFQKKDG